MGGLVNGVASSTVSVFDCRSHSWHQAPNMLLAREKPQAMAIDGKIYVRGLKGSVQVFDPKTQTWTYESREWKSVDEYHGIVANGHYGIVGSRKPSCCVVDSVLYSYYKGKFICHIQLADYGGKMAVLWDRIDRSSDCKGRKVWCAVVTLERQSSEDIWGTVEWCDDSEAVLKVPGPVAFVDVVAATL
ncbi:unnamed protein product [Microthlaspi erraticum]|uniref:FKB95-like N-terminal Kelch domain-containing protein n=1 Tax=Microthlaspi erraticum TaxID=1685480 RepID=A0A6D2I6K9_9BRAS|nr:unnamed protein product [Microthlaspi erraticum]